MTVMFFDSPISEWADLRGEMHRAGLDGPKDLERWLSNNTAALQEERAEVMRLSAKLSRIQKEITA